MSEENKRESSWIKINDHNPGDILSGFLTKVTIRPTPKFKTQQLSVQLLQQDGSILGVNLSGVHLRQFEEGSDLYRIVSEVCTKEIPFVNITVTDRRTSKATGRDYVLIKNEVVTNPPFAMPEFEFPFSFVKLSLEDLERMENKEPVEKVDLDALASKFGNSDPSSVPGNKDVSGDFQDFFE